MTSIAFSASHCAFIDVFVNHWSNNWSPGFLGYLKHHGCFKFSVGCDIRFVPCCHYSDVLVLMVVLCALSTAVADVGAALYFGSILFLQGTVIQRLWHSYKLRSSDNIQWPHYAITCTSVHRNAPSYQEKTSVSADYIMYQLKCETSCCNTYF